MSTETSTQDCNSSRRDSISQLFNRVLSELDLGDIPITWIQRCIITGEGEIYSRDFFEVVHSEMITELWNMDVIRGVIIRTSKWDILVAHETLSPSYLPDSIFTKWFFRIVTGEDIMNSGKVVQFTSIVEEIIRLEKEYRDSIWKHRVKSDQDSLDKIAKILAQ